MKRALRAFIFNPLTIIIPLTVLLWFGWQHYIAEARDLSRPTQNLLPYGTFDTFDKDIVPVGWSVTKNGDFTCTTSKVKGYVGGSAWSFAMKDYKTGNASLRSKTVSLRPHTSYLYKGFYRTTAPFDLLATYHYKDGSSQTHFIQSYPGENNRWTTDGFAFKTGDNIVAVSFMYRLAANGAITLDETYLEPRGDAVYPPSEDQPTASSLIPNSNVDASRADQPQVWQPFKSGDISATFNYEHDNQNSYLKATVTDYKNGETKWQYPPVAVYPAQRLYFAVDYRSDSPVDVVAEYLLSDGSRRFTTVATMSPADTWTHRAMYLEAPAEAKSLFVSLVLRHTGTVDSDNYTLQDVTKPGKSTFTRGLVSLTFDDGWQSVYDNALPIIDAYNYKATLYLNPSVINTKNFLSSGEAQDALQRGNQLAAHGYNHLDMTTVNGKQLRFQLETSKKYIVEKTANNQVDFATPYGKSDSEVQAMAHTFFRSLRSTDTGFNTRQNFDRYHLLVMYVGSKTTLAEISQALTTAKENHSWLIFAYHRVESVGAQTKDSDVIITPAVFRQQIEQIQQSGLPVLDVGHALDELLPQL